MTLQHTPRDTGLDLDYLLKLGEHFEKVAPRYRDFLDTTKHAAIDTGVLRHQVPGGMISNLVSQLREADALDRLQEVYEELPRTRADMGYPPLVTPTSQIVGVQATNNVLFGRYKMITAQVKDYCYGLYGRPPRPIDPKLTRAALKGYPRGAKPITQRTGDVLEPELKKAKKETKGIAKDIGDVLIYALYPTTGMQFLRWKHGLEEVPEDFKIKTLEDIAREDELIKKAKAGEVVASNGRDGAPARGPGTRSFNVFVGDEYFKVEVDPADGGGYGLRAITAPRPGAKAGVAPAKAAAPAAKPAAAPAVAAGETAIKAPLPGIVIRYLVEEGATVKAGDSVVILEAMKMENALPSPVDGVVKQLSVAPGARVTKDAVLVVIG